jgi:hypothetical protein
MILANQIANHLLYGHYGHFVAIFVQILSNSYIFKINQEAKVLINKFNCHSPKPKEILLV